jgi:hypothetical protein
VMERATFDASGRLMIRRAKGQATSKAAASDPRSAEERMLGVLCNPGEPSPSSFNHSPFPPLERICLYFLVDNSPLKYEVTEATCLLRVRNVLIPSCPLPLDV